MIKNTNRKTQQIGVCRPLYKQDKHELTIVLIGDDGQWSNTLDLDTRETSSAQFWVYQLPVKARTGEMKQSSNTSSEFMVRLAGDTAPAKLTNLSNLPKKQWMIAMFKMFARGPAVAVLVKDCRVSVTMHEG